MMNYIPCVQLNGVISENKLNLDSVKKDLYNAFKYKHKDKKNNYVFLKINSPGGSPGLSMEIYDYINYLKRTYNKRVIGFVTEAAASGGYLILCSCDYICVNNVSIVGSIGVIGKWFGFHKVLKTYNIDYKRFQKGEHKQPLDPFMEFSEKDGEWINNLQDKIFNEFIEVVKHNRNNINTDVFNGNIWIGDNAVKKGLADEVNTPENFIAQKNINATIKSFNKKKTNIGQILGLEQCIENILKNVGDSISVDIRNKIK